MAFDQSTQNTITSQPLDRSADPSTAPPAGSPPPSGGASTAGGAQPPAGMDPSLWAIYQKGGLTPGDRGSGFADWQYWQDVGPSQYNRLASDIAGTGSDQPTGTPGSGSWSRSGAGAAAGGGQGGGSALGLPGANIIGADYTTKTPVPYTETPQDSALLQTLLGRAHQSLNVDPNDPVIRSQVDPFRAEQDRSVKDYLSATAERSGPHSNQDAAARSGYEKAGQATAGFQGQVMQNELNARRVEIQNALAETGSKLSAEDQMALQRELGLVNAQLGQQGLALGQQQLGSQNDQFAATYGLNATNQANYWDRVYKGYIPNA